MTEVPETLRLKCQHLKIDKGFGYGSNPILAKAISSPGNEVSSQSLCMALTGHRRGPRYIEILEQLHEFLSNHPGRS